MHLLNNIMYLQSDPDPASSCDIKFCRKIRSFENGVSTAVTVTVIVAVVIGCKNDDNKNNCIRRSRSFQK